MNLAMSTTYKLNLQQGSGVNLCDVVHCQVVGQHYAGVNSATEVFPICLRNSYKQEL